MRSASGRRWSRGCRFRPERSRKKPGEGHVERRAARQAQRPVCGARVYRVTAVRQCRERQPMRSGRFTCQCGGTMRTFARAMHAGQCRSGRVSAFPDPDRSRSLDRNRHAFKDGVYSRSARGPRDAACRARKRSLGGRRQDWFRTQSPALNRADAACSSRIARRFRTLARRSIFPRRRGSTRSSSNRSSDRGRRSIEFDIASCGDADVDASAKATRNAKENGGHAAMLFAVQSIGASSSAAVFAASSTFDSNDERRGGSSMYRASRPRAVRTSPRSVSRPSVPLMDAASGGNPGGFISAQELLRMRRYSSSARGFRGDQSRSSAERSVRCGG